ncbi:MAG TPA: hypothetical protein VLE53_12415 [Gemmatimonadaceae bacterium]|nr:hypothetical protein [Gemmatimonadaceae bacterium]
MTSFLGKAANGMPALLGVILGVIAFAIRSSAFYFIGVVILVVFGLRWFARRMAGRTPRVAVLLIETWLFLSIALVALSTAAILWLTVRLPGILPGDESTVKAVSGALVGAATAYFAALWIKEIQEVGGLFSPGTQFRQALEAAFRVHPRVPDRTSRAYEAIYADRVQSGPSGWGLQARWQRAHLVAEHLKSRS